MYLKAKEEQIEQRYMTNQPRKSLELFQASFMPEQSMAVKIKLAQNEYTNNGPYVMPQEPKFREDYNPVLDNKPIFKVHSKINQDKYQHLKDQQSQVYNQEKFEVKGRDKEQFVTYFKSAVLTRNFIDNQYPDFIKKEPYQEPINNINNILRDPTNFSTPFQLYHRPLKVEDKSKFFGQNYDQLDTKKQQNE